MFIDQMRSSPDDEQLIAIDIDLWELPVLQRVLDGQGVKSVERLQLLDFLRTWVREADPDELRSIAEAIDPLANGNLSHPMPVAVEIGSNYRHDVSLASKL